ncbi:TetR family transcriptional regulator [Mycolicibacterium sp. P9-64]|uniref:TetR/AcrR family transcriptional regulator n=1 Tax=Mycolicibacterium sp. P9-64 TaxID=2024612 RepID=UPI001F5BC1EE|nr:TetR family transcriptional regulator [Mycolicibacterium sp. P9-64]
MDAALQIISESGVRSVTHRKICSRAGTALGSVNYHFKDLDDLLSSAFSFYVEGVSERYEASFSAARNDDQLADAVMDLIAALSSDKRNAILMWELYAEGGRERTYRKLVRKWSKRAKVGVEGYCSANTATALEAVWDGAVMQRILGDASLPDEELRRVVVAIIQLDSSRRYPADSPVEPAGGRGRAAARRRPPSRT